MSATPEENFSLVMPFVVCQSNGGPFEDRPFVAGYECGRIDAVLEHAKPGVLEVTVRHDNLPQLDLIAMRHNYSMLITGRPDDEEWVQITFTREAA